MSKLKYNDKKFFIAKTSLIPTKICGNTQRTYFITENLGYTIKKICHSNTHVAVNDGISKINNVYELEENKIGYKIINTLFDFTTEIDDTYENDNLEGDSNTLNIDSPDSIQSYITKKHNNMCLIDMEKVQEVYGYGDAQNKEIIDNFKLVKICDNIYIRISYKQIIKMICVYQTIVKTKGDKSELNSFYPKYICDWLISNFNGSSEEVVFYIILEHGSNTQDCKKKIEELVLDRIDKQALQNYIEKNMVYHDNNESIIKILDLL
ncbi:hypothetical protein BDAP_000863 [Binucleata daphniae]